MEPETTEEAEVLSPKAKCRAAFDAWMLALRRDPYATELETRTAARDYRKAVAEYRGTSSVSK